MQIWNYDDDGVWTSSGWADPDPMEPGNWLVPANATTIAPPAVAAKQVAVFVDGAWSVVADHRGETWYAGYKQPVVVEAVGTPAGLTATEPAPSAEVAAAEATARIAAAKAAVAAFGDAAAEQISGGPVPQAERLSWLKKELAARAFVAGTADVAQVGRLAAEGALTGETTAEVAAKIIANADLHSQAEPLIAGHRRATIALIDGLGATPTQAQIDAVLATAKTAGEAALAALLAG